MDIHVNDILKMKKAHAIGITNDGLAKAILDMYRKEEQR